MLKKKKKAKLSHSPPAEAGPSTVAAATEKVVETAAAVSEKVLESPATIPVVAAAAAAFGVASA